MSLTVDKSDVTPEKLLAMPDSVGFELVDGELKERNMGVVSSYVGGTIYFLIRAHVMAYQLGWVFPSDSGFLCFPNSPKTLRRPDVSFVRGDRLKTEDVPSGWLKMVPDMIVEVISPHDIAYEVETKIEEYRKVGVRLVWIVTPPTQTVRIIRSDGSTELLRVGQDLSGEDVIPNFLCPVASLFLPFAPEAWPS